MGFAEWPGTIDPVPDQTAPSGNLLERPGAVEFFIDSDVFGNHVAEAVLFAHLPHDPPDLLLADAGQHSMKGQALFQCVPEASGIVIPEKEPIADILRGAVR